MLFFLSEIWKIKAREKQAITLAQGVGVCLFLAGLSRASEGTAH
jgi:hypothetical protein